MLPRLPFLPFSMIGFPHYWLFRLFSLIAIDTIAFHAADLLILPGHYIIDSMPSFSSRLHCHYCHYDIIWYFITLLRHYCHIAAFRQLILRHDIADISIRCFACWRRAAILLPVATAARPARPRQRPLSFRPHYFDIAPRHFSRHAGWLRCFSRQLAATLISQPASYWLFRWLRHIISALIQ